MSNLGVGTGVGTGVGAAWVFIAKRQNADLVDSGGCGTPLNSLQYAD